MGKPLDPEPLLRRLYEDGIDYVIVGGFAVNAHGYIRPSKDLDIVPDPSYPNLVRLAATLEAIGAVHAETGDFDPAELPYDPTKPDDLAQGGNFRLETSLGDLDILQWVAGIDADDAYRELSATAITGMLDGMPIRVCSLGHLRSMKKVAGRPRDLDDLEHLPDADA